VEFFELYADEAAYNSHRESAHFKKYVATTKDMIKSRKLIETVPIQLSDKKK
jgi:quinol monooxygenase YgiN